MMNNIPNRYKIVEPKATYDDNITSDSVENIGIGAYGIVYKALDTFSNTYVALKKIKLESECDGISSSTLREITFLTQLKHDNIVRLRDVQLLPERISLIFDLEDCDLAKYLSKLTSPLHKDTVQVSNI